MVEVVHELLSLLGPETQTVLQFDSNVEMGLKRVQKDVTMGIRITLMVEVVYELLSLVGPVTPAHQMSVFKYQLQSVEMEQLILMRHVMMEIQIATMGVILLEILSLDIDVQATIRVNDHQYDKMEL